MIPDCWLSIRHKQIISNILFLTGDSTTALWYSYGQVLNEPETTRQECPFTSDLSQFNQRNSRWRAHQQH
jgi:hypothetical protein